MSRLIENQPRRRRAITIGVLFKDDPAEVLESDLDELSRLLETLGVETVSSVIQHRESQSARTLIGSGKVEEIRALIQSSQADLVVFDGDLSPTQARNLEVDLKTEVTDRTGVILQIFSQNARTHEAKLQIELAGLEYSLPRLKRQWTHLSRTRGGRGFMGGDGETQLETDKRYIREKIQLVKAKLDKIKAQRSTQKKSRHKFFSVAIVGYTNSGKSTLLNSMTASEVYVADKLFATLDPSTRIIKPDEKPAILFSDTVGFIKKLPHSLVASFRSTFEEIRDADLLLHVVDISDPDYKTRMTDTLTVLKELELDKMQRLIVFNKVDLKKDTPVQLKMIQSVYPASVMVSAAKNLGIEDLKRRIYEFFAKHMQEMHIRVTFGCESILEKLYELTRVIHTEYSDSEIKVHFRGATRDINYILDQLRREGNLLSDTVVPLKI